MAKEKKDVISREQAKTAIHELMKGKIVRYSGNTGLVNMDIEEQIMRCIDSLDTMN